MKAQRLRALLHCWQELLGQLFAAAGLHPENRDPQFHATAVDGVSDPGNTEAGRQVAQVLG